ncbi:unnamed protein product [Rhizophagus irregularis]|nr:unnamed protein product [Rhizophagus irregularis]
MRISWCQYYIIFSFCFWTFKVTSYVRFLISYESSKNSINFVYNVYPIIVVYGLIVIVAAFGLYVTTCANTPNMLSIYSKVFYGIIGFFILYSIMEIVEAITLSIVCTELSYLCGQNHLEIIIPVNIVLIILSLYFATVISTYVRKRKDEYINRPIYAF